MSWPILRASHPGVSQAGWTRSGTNDGAKQVLGQLPIVRRQRCLQSLLLPDSDPAPLSPSFLGSSQATAVSQAPGRGVGTKRACHPGKEKSPWGQI